MAGPYDRQRLEAIQELTPGRGDLEVGEVVPHGNREVHVDAPESVHDVLEAVEVQLDEVVDRYAEVLFDHVHQLARAVGERRVDLVELLRAHIRQHEVPRQGQDRQPVSGRVDVQEHDDVAVHAVDTGGTAAEGLLELVVENATRCRADHEDRLLVGVWTRRDHLHQVPDRNAVHLMVAVGHARACERIT